VATVPAGQVAKAVACQATVHGHKVRYLEAGSAFGQHALGDATEQRQQMRTLTDADLRVLDDLFLARRISDAGGELLQSLVHQRYRLNRSIVVTSNRVVQDWGGTSVTPPWRPPSSTD
jgi:DNA replication protein DnaC